MTFPGGTFGGDDPDMPDFLRGLFGSGDVPPQLAGLLSQFQVMSQGMEVSTKQLKASTALRLQQAGADLAAAEARLVIAQAEVAKYTAQKQRQLAPEELVVVEAELAAAQQAVAGYGALIAALQELKELAEAEAVAALGADAELFRNLLGNGPRQVAGDDVIPPASKPGDTPQA